MNYSYDQYIEAELASHKGAKKEDSEGYLTIDVFKDGDSIIIQSTVAGTDPNDIDISITKDMVVIKGHRLPTEKVDPSDYYHRELYWGSFSRSIILPADIDPDHSKASIKNGILTIKMPCS